MFNNEISYYLPYGFIADNHKDTVFKNGLIFKCKEYYNVKKNIKYGIYCSIHYIYDSTKPVVLDSILYDMFHAPGPMPAGDAYTGRIMSVRKVKYLFIHELVRQKNHSHELMFTVENGRVIDIIVENYSYLPDSLGYKKIIDSIFSSIDIRKT